MSPATRRQFLSLAGAVMLCRSLPAAQLSQFRLGVTSDEIDDDLLTAIRFLRRFGLQYAEIRNLWGNYNTSQPLDRIREARRLLDEYQIRTCILDTGFFKVSLPPDSAEGQKALEEQWTLLDAAMERAKILGTDKIRIFAFMYPRGGQADGKHYPRIVELLNEAIRRAKAGNFRLALENVGGSYVSTAAESARLLKEIPDQTLGLTWDPNNSARSGDPMPFPDGYKMLDPARIVHVHLRDYRRLPSGETEWCGVGSGEFDHVGQLRALLRDDYQETLSLETHYKIEGSKMKASEASLKGLLKAIEKV